jgi:hypothetical protein
MKKHFINALVAVGLLATLNSCSKEEQADVKPEATSEVVAQATPSFVSLDTVTVYYLTGRHLDITSLKDRKSYNKISDGNLTIDFSQSLTKMNGKDQEWGDKPYVVSKCTPYLDARFAPGEKVKVALNLSKKVTELGFELMQYKGYHMMVATYYDKSKNKKVGIVYHVTGSSPYQTRRESNAYLFAAQSSVPFDYVEIEWSNSTTSYRVSPYELNLAQFRYKLAQ